MKLNDAWANRRQFTGKASDNVRNSAIAGLAAVWLFSDTGGDHKLDALSSAPWGLLIAGAFFATSLGIDILHYFITGSIYYDRADAKEREIGGYDPEAEVEITKDDMKVPNRLYRAKVWALFFGFVMLTGVLVQAAAWS